MTCCHVAIIRGVRRRAVGKQFGHDAREAGGVGERAGQAGSLALPTLDPISEFERVPSAGLHTQHIHVRAETRMS